MTPDRGERPRERIIPVQRKHQVRLLVDAYSKTGAAARVTKTQVKKTRQAS